MANILFLQNSLDQMCHQRTGHVACSPRVSQVETNRKPGIRIFGVRVCHLSQAKALSSEVSVTPRKYINLPNPSSAVISGLFVSSVSNLFAKANLTVNHYSKVLRCTLGLDIEIYFSQRDDCLHMLLANYDDLYLAHSQCQAMVFHPPVTLSNGYVYPEQ